MDCGKTSQGSLVFNRARLAQSPKIAPIYKVRSDWRGNPKGLLKIKWVYRIYWGQGVRPQVRTGCLERPLKRLTPLALFTPPDPVEPFKLGSPVGRPATANAEVINERTQRDYVAFMRQQEDYSRKLKKLSNRLETSSRLQGDWRLETKGLSVSSL